MNVYQKHKLIIEIDMSNPLLDAPSNIYDSNSGISFKLKESLQRLQLEGASRQIPRLQLSLNDNLFKFFNLEKFKHDCNITLSNLMIILVTPPKLITNEEEKLSLIHKFHTDPLIGGHCGQKRLYAKLRSYYYWKNMPKYISKFVKSCELCKLNKIKPHTREPMVITETLLSLSIWYKSIP